MDWMDQSPDNAAGAGPRRAWPATSTRSRNQRLKLATLLGCLAASSVGLLATRTSVFSPGGAGGPVAIAANGCRLGGVPRVSTVDRRQLLELRASLLPAMSRVVGRWYEGGTITAENLWTDNSPQKPSIADRHAWPGGYEIRYWAATGDDVVADVLAFDGPAAARKALNLAASGSCRRSSTELAAPFPPGARNLIWVNPDGVTQEDVLLLRGRLIYRVADVRPRQRASQPSTAGERVGLSIVNSLACSLPQAGCPATGPGRLVPHRGVTRGMSRA
jgi:hypothetical protein